MSKQNLSMKKFYSPSTTMIMIINVMLGTGPIIVPPVFLLGGILLSSVWMFMIGFFSYLASEMIVEAISLCNAVNSLNEEKKKSIKLKIEKEQSQAALNNTSGISPKNKQQQTRTNTSRCVQQNVSDFNTPQKGSKFTNALQNQKNFEENTLQMSPLQSPNKQYRQRRQRKSYFKSENKQQNHQSSNDLLENSNAQILKQQQNNGMENSQQTIQLGTSMHMSNYDEMEFSNPNIKGKTMSNLDETACVRKSAMKIYPIECESNQNLDIQVIDGNKNSNDDKIAVISEDQQEQIKKDNIDDYNSIFSLKQIYEYQDIGKVLLGNNGQMICGCLICIYLFGVIVSKCIMTGKIMAELFDGIQVIDNYYFWLGIFFSCSSILSFKDVSSITGIQNFIGVIRFATIALFILLPAYIIIKNQEVNPITNFEHQYESKTHEYTPVNLDVFADVFSNLIFAFLVQHSIGALIGNNKPEKSMKKVMYMVYSICILSTFIIAVLAIMAFGGELANPYDEGGLKYYNTIFKGKYDWAYYFSSFYIFLNVASLPVLTIVLRNNSMKLITPEKFPQKSYELTQWTLIYTGIILSMVLLCSITLQNNIQYVLNITGGLCGVVIMLILPILFVLKGRQKVEKVQKELSNFDINIHRANFGNIYILNIVFAISVVLFIYNVYLSALKFINGGGGH